MSTKLKSLLLTLVLAWAFASRNLLKKSEDNNSTLLGLAFLIAAEKAAIEVAQQAVLNASFGGGSTSTTWYAVGTVEVPDNYLSSKAKKHCTYAY